MEKELIYNMMNGFYDCDSICIPPNLVIIDEFSEGKECSRLLDKIYHARIHLSQKLGSEEDADVETIINSMNQITKILAMKMFDYGITANSYNRVS